MSQPPKILLTGDYWHADFQEIISNPLCSTTLVHTDQLENYQFKTDEFDLVVIASSRRDQLSPEFVETIVNRAAPCPTIAVLGSWCEGESRSGKPWPGVSRIYWHQWLGRFERFISRLSEEKIADWQLPRTANDADRISQNFSSSLSLFGKDLSIGISSHTDTQYQMLADASKHFGFTSSWVEQQQWNADLGDNIAAVCMDADSWNSNVASRVDWLRDDLEITAPIVLVLNFPRKSDIEEALEAGVTEIVSKPFQLDDLGQAIQRAIGAAKNLAV
jgi:CheY-like chemotaxis protein